MKTPLIALCLAAAAVPIGACAQEGEPVVPIMLEGDEELDACSSVAVVTGLGAGKGGFLAVRAGPGTGYAKLDALLNEDRVFVCDERGSWLGIVYAKAGRDCGLSSPVPQARAYRGPCPSGWVHRKWIKVIAG